MFSLTKKLKEKKDFKLYQNICKQEYIISLQKTLRAYPKNHMDDKDPVVSLHSILRLEKEIIELRNKYNIEKAGAIL